MDIDEALAVLAALVGSAGHPEGDPALFVVRRELDAMRARVAALEAVAEAARAALDVDPTSRTGAEAHIRLEAALDAAPAAETHEVDVRPMTDDEIRAEQLTQPAGDPWLARCTCGAEMLPLYPGEANAWEQGHLGTRPWVQA
jgi:hypothetical protein